MKHGILFCGILTLMEVSRLFAQSNVLPTPPAPTGVSVSSTGGTGVKIAWSAVYAATHYTVYRHTGTHTTGSYIGSTSSTLLYDNVPFTPGSFYYRVHACGAGGCSNPSSYGSVYVNSTGGGGGGSSSSVSEGVDNDDLNFTSGGNSSWGLAYTSNSRKDGDAAYSGTIGHGGDSWFETTVTGPAELVFWWRSESERNYDYLNFKVNGSVVQSISGNTSWVEVSYLLPPGTSVLRWQYSKDGSVSHYGDRGWVDDLRVEKVAGGDDRELDQTSFEDGLESWSNVGAYSWKQAQAYTPSSYTGPYLDHTLQNYSGKFLYLESSYANGGTTAILESKALDGARGPITFTFWYHMYGYGMGSLHVDVWSGNQWETRWQRNGQQHTYYTTPWSQGTVDLSDIKEETKIRIRGVTSLSAYNYYHHRSDMALDDLVISQVIVPEPEPEIDWDAPDPFDFTGSISFPNDRLLVP